MQRGFLQDIESFNLLAMLVATSLRLGGTLTLFVDYELCVLHFSLGLLDGVPRRKVRRRNIPRWAPIYVTQFD
jgi:hypothetical protein